MCCLSLTVFGILILIAGVIVAVDIVHSFEVVVLAVFTPATVVFLLSPVISSGLVIILTFTILFLLVMRLGPTCLSLIINAYVFTEFRETDLAVRIMITPSQDGFLVISTGKEGIPLQEVDQIGHLDSLAASSNGVKGTNFNELWATRKLSLALVSGPL